MKEAKAKGLDVPSFYLASWNEMKGAKAKGLDVPSFYLSALNLIQCTKYSNAYNSFL